MPRCMRSFWIGLVLGLFSLQSLEALWYSPIALSGVAAEEHQISSDLHGNAIVVWREFDGVNTSIRSYSTRSANLATAETISTALGIYVQTNPQAVIDPVSKTSVVIWEELNGSDYTVKASSLPIEGAWSTPQDISIATAYPGLFPKIAISSSQGNVVAVWQRHDGANHIIQAATLTIGGSWSAAVNISSSLIDAHLPQIKVDGSGNAVAVWIDATNQTIQSATLPYGGSWSSPVDISTPGNANLPKVAINASGYAVAVWEQFNGSHVAIKSSSLQFGGSWSAPQEISLIAENASVAHAAVDANGNAAAVWQQISGTDILIQTAYLPSGGAWTAPLTLSSTGTISFDPKVTFDTSGRTFAVWNTISNNYLVVQAAMRPFGGSWSAPTQISRSGFDSAAPLISVAGIGGSAIVCWTDYTQGLIKATAWIPSPVVAGVSPNFGSLLGGNTVTITGKGFINLTSLYFGSQLCSSYVIDSPYQITAIAPEGSVGTVDIVVTTLSGASPITVNTSYTYQQTAQAPTITSIYINHGPGTGGNLIKIIGSNYINVTEVNFGSTPATNFTVLSSKVIIATAPAGSGMVDITVTTDAGTSAINVLDQYTYD